jgi:ACT domain-containing protein
MSNFTDFPKIGDSEKNRPILRIEQDIRSIRSSLNTLLIDTQSLKSDIAEIKEILKEKEKIEKMSGGWWIY